MPPLKLEVFDTGVGAVLPQTVVTDISAMEEARLASYENGYSAGWEDANKAQSGEQAQMRADLARNLQALGFTFQEARMHILRAVEPLLQDIVGRLLPVVARDALAPIVLEALVPLAEAMVDTPVTLVLNPAARPAIEALLEQATGLPLTLVEEPTLGESQVYLRLGATEVHINLDRAIAEITAAVRGFFDLSEKDRRHG